jgi:prepilin-type N-terminal cleavage/methylation domain-containing protein
VISSLAKPPVTSRRAGFSLIEVLIAMLVLSVGAASILSLFAAAASTHRRAVDRTHAALVAERVLSAVRARYTPGSTSDEILDRLRKELPENLGGYHYDVQLVHPQGKEWKESELFARVTVRWRQSGAERAESFQTILLPRHRLGGLPEN